MQWPVCRHRGAGLPGACCRPRPARKKILSLQASGLWALTGVQSTQGLRLAHAWPAFAWMTLRFHNQDPADAEALELTISKRGLTDDAWRVFRICVARQLALPQRPAYQGPASINAKSK